MATISTKYEIAEDDDFNELVRQDAVLKKAAGRTSTSSGCWVGSWPKIRDLAWEGCSDEEATRIAAAISALGYPVKIRRDDA